MAHDDAPGDGRDHAAAPLPQPAYPEWPEGLGDPQFHVLDASNAQKASATSRKEIVAEFRAKQPATAPALSRGRHKKKPQTKEFEDAQFPVRKCSFQVECHRGKATKKCHNCAKFDEQKLGYYCDACFDARHPAYRLDHSWISIQDDVNQEQEWASHITRLKLEQDAQELQLLLSETQQFLQHPRISSAHVPPPTPPATAGPPPGSSKTARRKLSALTIPPPPKQSAPSGPPPLHKASGEIDFRATYVAMSSLQGTLQELIKQIHTELARKPPLTKAEALLKIQRMWKIRSARKQLKALVHSVYASFQDPVTGETYYYNSKTKTTQWTKPKALGDSDELQTNSSAHQKKTGSLNSKKDATVKPKRVFGSREEQELDALLKIQNMLRAHKARVYMRRLISSVYEKIWDASSTRFYYHNTQTKQVKWEKPRWVSDADLLTPRSRQQQADEELKQQKLEALRLVMTEDRAAMMLQRAYRRRKGFESLLKLCRQVYERIFDPSQNAFYYHNTRTKETSWDKPAILRNVKVDVFTPRTRQKQLERSGVMIASSINSAPVVKTESVHSQWTEEQAAACLQGL
ncbi:hypothetical protein Gpo141_00013067, partial [Globisporangium polare]